MAAATEETVVPVDALAELGTRAALLTAIKAEVDREAKSAREAFDAAMTEARGRGVKSVDVRIPDELGAGGESTVATASFNKDGKPTVIVRDAAACVEWVAQRHPHQIQEIVHPTFLAHLLKALKIRPGGIITDEHGETVEWAVAVAGAPGSLALRFAGNDDGRASLLAAWLAGNLGDVKALELLPSPQVREG